jgi:hypothetical protein
MFSFIQQYLQPAVCLTGAIFCAALIYKNRHRTAWQTILSVVIVITLIMSAFPQLSHWLAMHPFLPNPPHPQIVPGDGLFRP